MNVMNVWLKSLLIISISYIKCSIVIQGIIACVVSWLYCFFADTPHCFSIGTDKLLYRFKFNNDCL